MNRRKFFQLCANTLCGSVASSLPVTPVSNVVASTTSLVQSATGGAQHFCIFTAFQQKFGIALDYPLSFLSRFMGDRDHIATNLNHIATSVKYGGFPELSRLREMIAFLGKKGFGTNGFTPEQLTDELYQKMKEDFEFWQNLTKVEKDACFRDDKQQQRVLGDTLESRISASRGHTQKVRLLLDEEKPEDNFRKRNLYTSALSEVQQQGPFDRLFWNHLRNSVSVMGPVDEIKYFTPDGKRIIHKGDNSD